MSGRRLAGTTAAMAAVAGVLALLAPPIPAMADSVLAAQDTADTAGPETLLLAAAGLLAWAVWAWGALGLLLTAASALPGALGWGADLLARVVLPGAARRSAALALGVGLGLTGPVVGVPLLVVTAAPAAAGPAPSTVPDWPAPDAVPDWPAPTDLPAREDHVVVRGDCLWDIAAARLSEGSGRSPSPAEIAEASRSWWAANADVVGPDPDLLRPGQVLRPPP
jgi:hypothetical protein